MRQTTDYENLVLMYEIDGANFEGPPELIVEKMKAGEKQLEAALWNKVRRLVISKAIAYFNACAAVRGSARFDVTDLIQSGYFAILEAVDYYEEDKGAKFITVLCKYSLKTAFAEVNHTRTSKRDCLQYSGSINETVGEDDDTELTEFIPDPEQDVETRILDEVFQSELHDKLEECLRTLTAEQEIILRRRFYEGQSLDQIAAEMDLSREGVRQKEKSSLKELYRNRFKNGLDQYLDSRTNFYPAMQDNGKRTNNSVEKIVERRMRLAEKWLRERGIRK